MPWCMLAPDDLITINRIPNTCIYTFGNAEGLIVIFILIKVTDIADHTIKI